jgi:hypothetical protein
MLLNCIEELADVEACTSAGRDGFFVHAEMWYRAQSDVSLLIAHPDDGPTTVTASYTGFLTGVGINANGFAQGVQSTFARDARIGVPRVLVSRNALCAENAEAATDAACAEDRAGGYGYVISTLGRHQILETSATEVAPVVAAASAVHTNHYVSGLQALARRESAESRLRLAQAAHAVESAKLESLSDCQALLAADGFRPCEPGDTGTIFSLACDLETGEACISDGDPREGRWMSFHAPGFAASPPQASSGGCAASSSSPAS